MKCSETEERKFNQSQLSFRLLVSGERPKLKPYGQQPLLPVPSPATEQSSVETLCPNAHPDFASSH